MSTLRKLRRKEHSGEYGIEPLRRYPPPRQRKMSEVLLDFADPILEDLDDRDFKAAIAFSSLCWNLALLRSEDQRTHLNDAIEAIAESEPFKHRKIQPYVRMLVDRKKALFADDKRLIIDYKVVEEAAGPRLLVMSTPVKSFQAANL